MKVNEVIESSTPALYDDVPDLLMLKHGFYLEKSKSEKNLVAFNVKRLLDNTKFASCIIADKSLRANNVVGDNRDVFRFSTSQPRDYAYDDFKRKDGKVDLSAFCNWVWDRLVYSGLTEQTMNTGELLENTDLGHLEKVMSLRTTPAKISQESAEECAKWLTDNGYRWSLQDGPNSKILRIVQSSVKFPDYRSAKSLKERWDICSKLKSFGFTTNQSRGIFFW